MSSATGPTTRPAPAFTRRWYLAEIAAEPELCATFDVFQDAPDAVEGTNVECGYLIVPEQRVEPTEKTIKLGIVIIKSTSDNPAGPLAARFCDGWDGTHHRRLMAKRLLGRFRPALLQSDHSVVAAERRRVWGAVQLRCNLMKTTGHNSVFNRKRCPVEGDPLCRTTVPQLFQEAG